MPEYQIIRSRHYKSAAPHHSRNKSPIRKYSNDYDRYDGNPPGHRRSPDRDRQQNNFASRKYIDSSDYRRTSPRDYDPYVITKGVPTSTARRQSSLPLDSYPSMHSKSNDRQKSYQFIDPRRTITYIRPRKPSDSPRKPERHYSGGPGETIYVRHNSRSKSRGGPPRQRSIPPRQRDSDDPNRREIKRWLANVGDPGNGRSRPDPYDNDYEPRGRSRHRR